ncbi:hypothetical protein SDC9_163320 [bioreactor metagenome]|uniref:Uncharacterized protein n=1 Tax=bioreactor metagenome TaxID=1076179 RepID=A0A645FVD6_9ZZZZ
MDIDMDLHILSLHKQKQNYRDDARYAHGNARHGSDYR